jgi:hypothetical protein
MEEQLNKPHVTAADMIAEIRAARGAFFITKSTDTELMYGSEAKLKKNLYSGNMALTIMDLAGALVAERNA